MTIPLDIVRDAQSGRSPAARLQTLKSASGLEVWLFEDHTRPLVNMSFGCKSGLAQEPLAKRGLIKILADMMVEGAGDLDSSAFQMALDDKAIELDFSADCDNLTGSLRTMTRHASRAFDLLGLALREPRFDESALDRVVSRAASSLRYRLNEPDAASRRAFDATAFGDHPYANSIFGDLSTLPTITCHDLRTLYRRTLAQDTLAIVIVGDIDAETTLLSVDRVFGKLPRTADLLPVSKVTVQGMGTKQIVSLDLPQSTIQFGRPGIARHDPDFVTAIVINHCLGGGVFSSRLFREVREKRGLCYSVYSQVIDYDHTAVFAGMTAVKNERVVEAVDVIESEIELLGKSGLTKDEVDQAKRYLIGSYALRFDTSSGVARIFLRLKLSGYEATWVDQRNRLVEAVLRDDVERVVERLVGDGRMLVTIAGAPVGL